MVLQNKEQKKMSWLFSFWKQESHQGCTLCHGTDHTLEQCYTFKTKLCRHFEKGFCAYGNECIFAHGHDQLRVSPVIPAEFQNKVRKYKKQILQEDFVFLTEQSWTS